MSPKGNFQLDIYLDNQSLLTSMKSDILNGLTSIPRQIPPKYFYDKFGSELCEQITELPEFYPSRVESAILVEIADSYIQRFQPRELIEIGAGYSTKTKIILDSMEKSGDLVRYIPLDVSESAMRSAATIVNNIYPNLEIHAIVGDFEKHLIHIPSPTINRLVLFLGSTIGNLNPDQRKEFLVNIKNLLGPNDHFLLGIDLVKDVPTLEAAYNDAQAITAQFNRNVLNVINQHLGGNFVPGNFSHHAFFNSDHDRIEMHLVANSLQKILIRELGLNFEMPKGESIWTENSYKFDRVSAVESLAEAGLEVENWYEDPDHMFAAVLSKRGSP